MPLQLEMGPPLATASRIMREEAGIGGPVSSRIFVDLLTISLYPTPYSEYLIRKRRNLSLEFF